MLYFLRFCICKSILGVPSFFLLLNLEKIEFTQESAFQAVDIIYLRKDAEFGGFMFLDALCFMLFKKMGKLRQFNIRLS